MLGSISVKERLSDSTLSNRLKKEETRSLFLPLGEKVKALQDWLQKASDPHTLSHLSLFMESSLVLGNIKHRIREAIMMQQQWRSIPV